jgi:hypothetical protein
MKTKIIATFAICLTNIISTANAKNIPSALEITGAALVQRTSVSAGKNNTSVVLNWSAKNEAGQSHYEIERSFYSNNFSTIATLEVPFANGGGIKNYSISDDMAALTGRLVVYYRIKQVDEKGTVTYSNITVVKLSGTPSITNIKTNNCIHFSSEQNGNAVVRLLQLTGEATVTKTAVISKGINTLELDNLKGLTKGIYIAEVSINGVVAGKQKIVVE